MTENQEKLAEAFPKSTVSDSVVQNNDNVQVKSEQNVKVKMEAQECVLCTVRDIHTHDIYSFKMTVSGSSLYNYLAKFTSVDITKSSFKFICKGCVDLLNVLEQAEHEYLKIKQTFEEILSKNPLFDSTAQVLEVPVKKELYDDLNGDSEDEPLIISKKKQNHRSVKRRKKSDKFNSSKRKEKNNKTSNRWQCNECGVSGIGGPLEETAHKLAAHTLNGEVVIKKEDDADGDGMQNSNYVNDFENANDEFDVEFDFDDDDDYVLPDDASIESNKEILDIRIPKKRGRKPTAELKCSECNATYHSITRLENHKRVKHSGFGPPYICEICGAKYKHKRACDIHIQMHKGISDWKCEECNKLFPSKGALRRHNNIHTGNAMYQCDLCGKSFIHTSSFKMHKLSHSGVKPHACAVCGLALLTSSHLKRHLRIHTGEKRYDCHVCGKKFSERYNMLAHAKSHETTTAALPTAPDAPRRRFRCAFCTERFERKYLLERHMSAAHGRTLERAPPTPRNTMSKLLKQQATVSDATLHDCPSEPTPSERSLPPAPHAAPPAAHAAPPAPHAAPPAPHVAPPAPAADTRTHTPDRQKLNISVVSSSGAWSSGTFAQEFRNNYSH